MDTNSDGREKILTIDKAEKELALQGQKNSTFGMKVNSVCCTQYTTF